MRAKLRETEIYFDVMGPMYARNYDPVAAQAGRLRGILSPDALNMAFAPGGFLQTFDLRTELARISAQTLILAGRHDWICPVEFSEEIQRLIPGSELCIFESSSHSVRNDAPQDMRDAIAGFVV